MRCESCGASNGADNRFCGQCGSIMAQTCPACGSAVPSGQPFCGQCGSRVGGDMPPEAAVPTTAAPEPTPDLELHWASVLFVDLVEYTSLTQGWDAADVRELLSGYFDAARTVVDRYGGVIEKFIGDAVVAVWGSDAAHEDDAERCVRAGLEVIEAVAEYGTRRGTPSLAARAGVVTGQVASWGASGEGLVAGDRVNTAARVQSAAKHGSVLVDDVTMRATRATVAYSDAGEHDLKGISEPMRLWTAVRVVAGVGGSQRVDGLEAAFVGRTRELTLVKELFHATVESGRARLVSVTGQAGIGKTRLSWEFEKYLDGLAMSVFWHRGRCLSYGDGVAFWALAEMVRQRLGIAEDDSSDVAGATLRSQLPQWLPDDDERTFVESRLSVLVGAVEREYPRQELFAAWRLFFERLADQQPVVLVLEDLHWADRGLFEFLEYLLDWSSARPLYVLTFARPEFSERSGGAFAHRRNVTSLHLDPLPEPVLVDLLEDLVPGMPGPVKAKIAAQAAGVPLYAVETIRALIDRDLVIPRDGVYRLVGDIGELDVPASLTSLIAARLDELPPDERELVKGLAILGSSFPRHAVSAVSTATPERIDTRLQALVRKDILTVRADPLSPERGQYEFVQSMLRSVAHDMLSRRDRKARHLAVAAYLRSAFPDDGAEVVEVIATHYHDAYLAARGDDDADELRADASRALDAAGTRARALGSVETARKHFLAAAGLTDDEADRARLTVAAARMSMRGGRTEESLELCQQAARIHAEAGRPLETARLAARISPLLFLTGHRSEAITVLQDALSVLDGGETPEDAAELHAVMADLLIAAGSSKEAAEHTERALVLATAFDVPEALATALNARALGLLAEHRVVEAAAHLSATVDASQGRDLQGEATSRGNLGDLRVQSDLSGAEPELVAAHALCVRLGFVLGQAINLGNLALLHFYAGRWDRTESYAREAIDVSPDDGMAALGRFPLVLLYSVRGSLAEANEQVHGLSGWEGSLDPQDREALMTGRGAVAFAEARFRDALSSAGEATLDAAKINGFRSEGFRLAWPLALDAAMRAGEIDEAKRLLSLVADAPPGHAPPYIRAQLARYRALVRVAEGDRSVEIGNGLRGAVNGLRDLGYPYWLARAQADLGQWLAGRGRRADAEPLLVEARDILSDLGAQPDLERVIGLIASATGAELPMTGELSTRG
jgi:class 3 adenylate cyclase/predicted ATPase